MTPAAPNPRSVLSALPKIWLAELGRELSVDVPEGLTKDVQLDAPLLSPPPLADLVGRFGRDELRVVCYALSLDDRAGSRGAPSAPRPRRSRPSARSRCLLGAIPRKGDIVRARDRQYLMSDVGPRALLDELRLTQWNARAVHQYAPPKWVLGVQGRGLIEDILTRRATYPHWKA